MCSVCAEHSREEEVSLALGVANELQVAVGGEGGLVGTLTDVQGPPETGEHRTRIRLQLKPLQRTTRQGWSG